MPRWRIPSVLERLRHLASQRIVSATVNGTVTTPMESVVQIAHGTTAFHFQTDQNHLWVSTSVPTMSVVGPTTSFTVSQVPNAASTMRITAAPRLVDLPGVTDIRVHPDGRRIAVTVQDQTTRQPAEVWVLENFLPKAPSAVKK